MLSSPVAVAQPIEIPKPDIRERRIAPVSNMPEGILNVLSKDQILDLMAYLLNDGKPSAAAFR